MEFAGKALKGAGLLHGVQVGALQVFDDGDLHRLFVGDLAEDGGNGRLAGQLRGTPAAFASDELEAAIGLRADQDGLNDSIGRNGGGQLSQLLLVDLGARLEGVAVDLVKGDLARLSAFGVGCGGCDVGSGRGEAGESRPLPRARRLGIEKRGGHDSKSSNPGVCPVDLDIAFGGFGEYGHRLGKGTADQE